ncbi:MAG TPA: histidine kinase [Longimicrobiaceae bacterium]|jgi:signal transduction histidine kinase
MTPVDPFPFAGASAPPEPIAWRMRWLILAGFWLLIALVDASQVYFSIYFWDHREVGFGEAMGRVFAIWLLWALLTPAVFRLAGRFPLERGRLRGSVPVHLAAAAGISLFILAVYAWTTAWAGWPGMEMHTGASLFKKYLTGKVHLQLLTYGVLVGAYFALDYHRRFRERELTASQLEGRLAQAHLQALRTQLHPHFLFNTLNAVSVLVLKGESQSAIRMLSRLSDLLRLTLESGGAQEVTLGEELGFLERYMEIERVRFQDRLTVETRVEPEALGAAVPNLLMQPLVENAVRHGIAERVEPGTIRVAAGRRGARLRLEVSDTGPGFPARVVDGIGLSNTRARLERLYGADGRLELGSAPGGGAHVVVEIPFRVRVAAGEGARAAEPAGAAR